MKLLANRALLIAICILIAFSIATHYLPHERLKLYLDSARVGVWATVWVITLKLSMKFFFINRVRTGGEIFAIAVNLTAGIVLLSAIWIPFNRELAEKWGIPLDWRNTVSELVVLGYMVSGVFYLMPIGNSMGFTPPRNYWFLLIAGVIGALISGVMIGLGLSV